MGPISAETLIDAPRERVWELIADLGRRPAFCDHFQHEFRLERLEPRGVGASARFRVEAPRMKFWMESVIEEVDEPHRIFERGQGGRLDRVPMFTVWELTEGAGRTTEAKVTFWTEPPGPVDRMKERMSSRHWMKRQWSQALERLKDLAESGHSVEPMVVAGADPAPR